MLKWAKGLFLLKGPYSEKQARYAIDELPSLLALEVYGKKRIEEHGNEAESDGPWTWFAFVIMSKDIDRTDGGSKPQERVVSDRQFGDAQKQKGAAHEKKEAHVAIWITLNENAWGCRSFDVHPICTEETVVAGNGVGCLIGAVS